MKILVVAEDFPWPSTGGGMIRLGKIVEALSALGKTDLYALYDPRRDAPLVPPPTVAIERIETVPYPVTPRGTRWRAAWLGRRGVPLEVVMRAGDPLPRRRFESWAADRYDLVWFGTPAMFAWLGRPRLGPTIVDVDNLEDEKARQRAELLRTNRHDAGFTASLRQRLAAAQTAKNAGDWRIFQRSVADQVERVVLCSDEDVRRSGLPNAVVIPNTYPRPARTGDHESVGNPPTLLLQGSLHYGPNMDAVEWLLGQIAPKLWAKLPAAEIRLVGRTVPGIRRWHRPPAVTVVGSVPEMEPELARADLAVVPLRIGSGTRLKVLESFAHRLPVVSTTIGADGLDVRNGVHLLLADTADDFATACHRLLVDTDLRTRMLDAAERLFLGSYEWSTARDRVQQLARDVAGESPRRRPGS
jgi:glycosyltransferase involved in cell wall biosynthesis